MRYIRLVITFLLMALSVLANEISIEVKPSNPVAGEAFNVIFTVSITGDETPEISFDHSGAEVSSKAGRGQNIETMFINGKLITKKQVITAYEFTAEKPGTVYLKNIQAKVGGSVIKHGSKSIRVAAGRVNKDFFAMAIPSKQSAYVGEGISVRYYLYYTDGVSNYDVAQLPKLRKFLKRFVPNKRQSDSVTYEGQIYRRELLYTARVFAQKPGKYKIDPIKLKVQYASRERVNPFGNNPFGGGIGFRRMRSRTTSSRPIDINVIPLPAENVPANFTGLVGKHTFELEQVKEKYLVNEGIELKLAIKGGGALEALEAPTVYSHNELEEFETNSDLVVNTLDVATKTYEYTYLARAPFKIPGSTLSFSYFDPASKEYKQVDLNLQGLSIFGANSATARTLKPSKEKDIPKQELPTISARSKMIAPIFGANPVSAFSWHLIFNVLLALGLIYLLVKQVFGTKVVSNDVKEAEGLLKKLKKDVTHYSSLFSLIQLLDSGNTTRSLTEIIQDTEISKSSKEYFENLVASLEKGSFNNGVDSSKVKYHSGAFNELLKILKGNK